MNNTIINSTSHELYAAFHSVYTTSFPIFEQRTDTQQEEAFADSRYHLIAYTDDSSEFVGFIGCWEFDTYCYIDILQLPPQEEAEAKAAGYSAALLLQQSRKERP